MMTDEFRLYCEIPSFVLYTKFNRDLKYTCRRSSVIFYWSIFLPFYTNFLFSLLYVIFFLVFIRYDTSIIRIWNFPIRIIQVSLFSCQLLKLVYRSLVFFFIWKISFMLTLIHKVPMYSFMNLYFVTFYKDILLLSVISVYFMSFFKIVFTLNSGYLLQTSLFLTFKRSNSFL